MIQYNLRIDEELKRKAQQWAEKDGMSENLLYNKAIEDYLRRKEHQDFIDAFLKRKVNPKRVKAILDKIRKADRPPVFKDDI
ncbi:MAG: hypothetical protein Q7T11_01555 [Deltaproteobacteria bacterium]|nr:hypothetical protein [Deltaproteobacteria bacterium]